MKKIPIDIVLLPPDDIMDLCINLSERAYHRGENQFLRSKTDRLPHISIMMGCLHEEDKNEVINLLETVLKDLTPLQLILTSQNTNGGLDIKKTKELTGLQEKLIENINPLLHQDCELTDLLEDEFDKTSRLWVNDFVEISTGEKFNPHITTHNTREENIKLPINFLANRVALCHMGDHGTCKKILWETNLKNN